MARSEQSLILLVCCAKADLQDLTGALSAGGFRVEAATSQAEAVSATESGSAAVMKRWNDFKTSDLPALNRQLRDAKVSEIRIESDLHQEESQADEE